MPFPDISRRDIPVGPLRDAFTVTLGDNDYELAHGFICQAFGTSGVNVVVRALEAESDATFVVPSTGQMIIGIGNHPVLLVAVRGHLSGTDSSVTSLWIGRL